ncbi:MAG: hypothetical protein ACK559_25795, partial [bacterium]
MQARRQGVVRAVIEADPPGEPQQRPRHADGREERRAGGGPGTAVLHRCRDGQPGGHPIFDEPARPSHEQWSHRPC